jgi:hypothetical protein
MSDPNKNGDCCHCAISQVINEFIEDHRSVNIMEIIDDLNACLCELIAYHDNPKVREQVAKHMAEMIPKRVLYFREIGRYPGGECSGNPQSEECSDIPQAATRADIPKIFQTSHWDNARNSPA